MRGLSERICSSEDETGRVGPNATDMYLTGVYETIKQKTYLSYLA
jgi:hypothetical protein